MAKDKLKKTNKQEKFAQGVRPVQYDPISYFQTKASEEVGWRDGKQNKANLTDENLSSPPQSISCSLLGRLGYSKYDASEYIQGNNDENHNIVGVSKESLIVINVVWRAETLHGQNEEICFVVSEHIKPGSYRLSPHRDLFVHQ